MREQVTTTILDAAEQIIGERGLDGASTAAIATRAGVAVGTLYNYFPDRDSLIASLFRARRAELLPRLSELARAGARQPFERRLRGYVTGVFEAFERHRAFVRVALELDRQVLETKNRKPVVMAAVTETLTDILRPVHGKQADAYARMLFGALKALVHRRVEHDEPLVPDADLVVDTFLHGMGKK